MCDKDHPHEHSQVRLAEDFCTTHATTHAAAHDAQSGTGGRPAAQQADGGHGHAHEHHPEELRELALLVEKDEVEDDFDCKSPPWSKYAIFNARCDRDNALRLQALALIAKSPSPVDLFENHEQVRTIFSKLRLHLKWGRKASHRFAHAYVLRYSQEEGAYFTIWSDFDLSTIDTSLPWKSYDLFEEEK